MSGRLVGEVLDHAPTDLRPGDLLVLVALAENARDHDRTARTRSSSTELAYRCRSTPGAVRNALARLKERGLIRPVHATLARGRQQNWIITKLSDYHREGAAIRNPNASPPGDTLSLVRDPATRHPPVTRQPVDNHETILRTRHLVSPNASPPGDTNRKDNNRKYLVSG